MRRFGNQPQQGHHYTPRIGVYAIITKGHEVLLTEQSDPSMATEIQLPGGGIDAGEQRLPALHREAFEETCWKIAPRRHFATYKRYTYMPEYDLYAMKIAHIFLCHAVRRLGPPSEPHHRELWAPLEAAPNMLGPAGDAHYMREFNQLARFGKNNG